MAYRIRVLSITWVLMFSLSCASARVSSGGIQFFVIAAPDQGSISKASVLAINNNGVSTLGVTQAGLLTIGRGTIEQLDPSAILVCAEGYFCGAFLVRGTDFLSYDEHLITLAPYSFL